MTLRARSPIIARLFHPAALFVLVSLLSGLVVITVTPPLRGADEPAHFLRAYGVARGDIVPRQSDAQGRKGLLVSQPVAAQFSFFDDARQHTDRAGFSYRAVFADYARANASMPAKGDVVFLPYGGSEGYTPVAYLPFVAAAMIAGWLGLDFLPALYLMRLFGLLSATAIIAYAITRAPTLRWALFAIAMLPTAIFGRAVVTADCFLFAATLLALSLCLNAAAGGRASPAARGVWVTLAALAKPSQVVFVLLEAMTRPVGAHLRGWRIAAAVMLPGIALSLLWIWFAGTEMAAWRLTEGGSVAAEQFQPGWKLRYMLQNPLHFPAAMFTSFDALGDLWLQLMGAPGWGEIRLQPWAYAVLTILLMVASVDRFDAARDIRLRAAVVALAIVVAYTLLVFALLFITSTPVSSDRVLGVQGRYFIVLLPLVALIVAAANPRAPPRFLQAGSAVALALIGTFAIVEAMIRMDWK